MFVLLFFLILGCELFRTEVSVRRFRLSFSRASDNIFYYMRLFLYLLIIIKPETLPNTLRESEITKSLFSEILDKIL
jgi:hypothetical protein